MKQLDKKINEKKKILKEKKEIQNLSNIKIEDENQEDEVLEKI